MRILLIITGHTIEPVRSLFENTDAHFAKASADATLVPYAVCEDHEAPDLSEFEGVIMTGSAAMLGDDLPWMRIARGLITQCLEDEIPFLGVCFGHQMLGAVCGSRVGPNPYGRANGTTLVEICAPSPIFEGLPSAFYAQVSHRDVVLENRPDFRVIATTRHDSRHAIQVGHAAFGVQFHPEWTAEVSSAYIDARAQSIGPEVAARMRETLRESPLAPSVLQNFVKLLKTAPNRVRNPPSLDKD